VVGDEIAVRDVLDLTVTIDHDVVDGPPATRFGADLRHRMEYPTADLGLGCST
jgi:pyruvate/2-oxoglutarate dehydrogenase complex dihydrolipoamide acyltransferase (E2) component